MDVGDGGGGDGETAVMGGGEGACLGSGEVNERDCCSSGKASHIVSHSFSNSFSMRGGTGDGDVSCVKSQRSMSSISSLISISKVSSVTFVFVEGS